MGFLNFLFPFIDQFTTGNFIRKFFSVLYQIFGWTFLVVGVLTALFGVYASIESEKVIIIVGTLVCLPIIAVGGYLLMQISLYKAQSISKMDRADYTAIPIVSLFIKYLGEMFLAILAIQGLFFLLASLFVTDYGLGLAFILREFSVPLPDSLVFGSSVLDGLFDLFDLRRGNIEERGLIFLIQTLSYLLSLINGVLVMLFFYFLAEVSLVLADIAANTKRLLSQPIITSADETDLDTASCGNCGFQNERDDMFCTNCGQSLNR